MKRYGLLLLLLVNCGGPSHIKAFTPRERKFAPVEYAADQASAEPSEGSIYTEGVPGFLEDTRALRAGDIVQIRINEEANAQGDASTDLKKETNRNASMEHLLGLMPALKESHPNIDPAALIALASSSEFSGSGDTKRSGKLSGSIGVYVRRQLPNGDLYVEGTKVVMINHEEYHLYISGVVRPSDIDQDNAVPSSLVADARVEFTGRGDIDDQVERGWFTELMDYFNPF